MILSFNHKGLENLFYMGETSKIDKKLHNRILRRLDVLNAARSTQDLNVPGFNFHPLNGFGRRAIRSMSTAHGASHSSLRTRPLSGSISSSITDETAFIRGKKVSL